MWAAFAIFALTGRLLPHPALEAPRAALEPDFFTAVGLARTTAGQGDVWKVAESGNPLPWMTRRGPFSQPAPPAPADSFRQLLDRVRPDDPPQGTSIPGLVIDPGRWRYQLETAGGLFKRKSKWDLADPNEVLIPYAARDWKAQEKLQIPVPIPLPVAEQLFVYSQFDGSGDALNPHLTSLSGKTGVGLKWSLIARSELQVRYATLFSYADDATLGRFQERTQPAIEVMARVPLMGPLEVEYTGSALPALARTDMDQIKQELRFAVPFNGDSEVEFGARYRWELNPNPTPWVDRAQLFLGVKFRH